MLDERPCLYVIRTTLYGLVVFLSFFCFVPIAVSMTKHEGYCLLYTTDAAYGPVYACGYTVSVPIVFSFLYGIGMFIVCLYNLNGHPVFTTDYTAKVGLVVIVFMDFLSWLAMLANAGVNSAGFNTLCWSLFGDLSKCENGYLYHSVFGLDDMFWHRHKMAEVCSWLSWVFWTFQFMLGMYYLWKSGLLAQIPVISLCPCTCCRPMCFCTCRIKWERDELDENGMPRPRV